MYIPLLIFLLAFIWHTKDYDKSWSTWHYRWWWVAGVVVAEILIQLL